MSAVDIPSVEEIHQISYLTMKGWKYSTYGGWTHKEYSQKVQKKQPCGCCEKSDFVDEHSLEQAYDAQLESEEP